jgi:hypothetical protein
VTVSATRCHQRHFRADELRRRRPVKARDLGGHDRGGYRELLEILTDPARPEHDERREWLGRPFDPEAFDPHEFEDKSTTYLQEGSEPEPIIVMERTVGRREQRPRKH